ncbi:MAG: TldD/PmbA family protein [Clostridiales bacterium]|jgi:PmbA protein|nr:TldD/PmbA family protein [Clostridiales bacterium]
MEFREFRDNCFIAAARRGFECFELYYAKSTDFSVRVRNGEISEYKNASQAGLCFRGIYKGKMGYAFTERLDEELIEALLEKAAENARVIDSDDEERLFREKTKYPEANLYNPELDKFSETDKIQMALRMEKAALETDSRVKSADYCTVSSGGGDVLISNSYGLDLTHKSNLFCAYLEAHVEENGVVKTWFDFWYGRDLAAFSPEELARNTVQTALSYLPAKSLPSGEIPVLFSPCAAADLFNAFVSVFFAERVQKGFSLLKDKVGAEIASAAVTIRDDGICDRSITGAAFDSEGVPCRRKVIIDRGVLKTLLYNLKSADKDKTESTGNGFKHSFRAPVETACTNFYIEPSDIPQEEIISSIPRGILITDLAGLHSGANAITGDFSLSAAGRLIEDGKIVRPVEQIVVSGNFYDLLHSITTVGNDLRFGLPGSLGIIGMPSILVDSLKIAGE